MLRTIIIIVLIWYGLKLVFRLVGPWLMKKGVQGMQNKAQRDMHNQFGGGANRSSKPEGTITVEKPKGGSDNRDGEDGEYVDYEEIK